MSDRLLSDDEVTQKIPLSKTQRWRLEKLGQFPQRIKIGTSINSQQGRVGWSESEIDEWIAARKATRNTEPDAA
jgi:prophage regulatory protein